VHWVDGRAGHEAAVLADIIDALLGAQYQVAMEIAVRRFEGLKLVSVTGRWEAAEASAWRAPGQSFLPRAELSRVLTDTTKLIRASRGRGEAGGSSRGESDDSFRGTRGRGSRGRGGPFNSESSSSTATPPAKAGASGASK